VKTFNIVNIKASWVPRDGCSLCFSTDEPISPHAANNSAAQSSQPTSAPPQANLNAAAAAAAAAGSSSQQHKLLPQLMDRHNQQQHKLQCLQLQIRLLEYPKMMCLSFPFQCQRQRAHLAAFALEQSLWW
jgi:hypothetical protein